MVEEVAENFTAMEEILEAPVGIQFSVWQLPAADKVELVAIYRQFIQGTPKVELVGFLLVVLLI